MNTNKKTRDYFELTIRYYGDDPAQITEMLIRHDCEVQHIDLVLFAPTDEPSNAAARH